MFCHMEIARRILGERERGDKDLRSSRPRPGEAIMPKVAPTIHKPVALHDLKGLL